MPKPREQQISLSDTPYYHICSRVVRQAYLCGVDVQSGKNYEHRREWVERRIHQLAQVFAISICAYAVMHNHIHLVVCVDAVQASCWSDMEVVNRWQKLFKGTILTQRFSKQDRLTSCELHTVKHCVEVYRKRLMDISWFMRSLNEYIARKANAEDNCTGRFWEGRFKSQALLDNAALLTCMAYVDLNPVRAKVASTPERSEHTSVQLRIRAARSGQQPKSLAKFVGADQGNKAAGLNFSFTDYHTLIDHTGRSIREDKRGLIEENALPILKRLYVSPVNWLKIATEFERVFTCAVGAPDKLTTYYKRIGLSRRHGIANAQQWLSSG